MNPVACLNALSAVVIGALAIPLMRGAVKMNHVYGIRVPQAFESEERWFAINRYGGRLVLRWALTVLAFAVVGLFLPRSSWRAYNTAAVFAILGGVALITWMVFRFARSRPNQPLQRNAGSRPSSGGSPASETPSSPGPRG